MLEPLQRAGAAARDYLFGNPRIWISPRHKRFWAVIVLLGYALLGFFVAPWVARQQIVAGLGEFLQRPVTLADLRINPFVLSAEASGFAITEPDGSPLLGFDRLYVNFQLSSLFRRAYSFREIALERPSLALVRLADGTTNFTDLIPTTDAVEERAPSHDDALPRLVVGQLQLVDGEMAFTDLAPATPFQVPVGPINATLRNLSTLPEAAGDQRVLIQTPRGTQLIWSGSLQLNPLRLVGQLEGSGPYLPLLYLYLQDQLAVTVEQGTADFTLDYDVAWRTETGLNASVENLAFVLRDIAVQQAGASVVSLPEVRIDGGFVRFPEQAAGGDVLALKAPEVAVWRDPDGMLNLANMMVDGAAGAETAEPAETGLLDDWTLRFEQVELSDLRLRYEDRTLRDPGVIDIVDLDLNLTQVSNQPNQRIPLAMAVAMGAGGTAQLAGDLTLLPVPGLDASLTATDLSLAVAQPYVKEQAAVGIESGLLNLKLKLRVDEQEAFAASGALALRDLAIVESAGGEALLGWQQVTVDQFAYSVERNELDVSEIGIVSPYARLAFAADGTNNLQRLMAAGDDATTQTPEPVAQADPAATSAEPLKLTVARIGVDHGTLEFSDRALPLPFSTRIADLQGQLTTFATGSTEPSQLSLEGQVDDYGLARIKGSVMVLGPTELADVDILFRNVALPDLSPYTVKFAGQRVADGRMGLDLNYVLRDGKLTARNNIVISDLQLGEKVDYPDAYDLPLGLAIALLKGPDGRINLDVPVAGDVNDPEFRIGGVVAKAMASMITKIVTSPFRLLGSLVGVQSEDFDVIDWTPGSAKLMPPEREKLAKLAEALTLRPQLVLRVQGVMDPAADRAALQIVDTDARIDEYLNTQAAEGDGGEMLAERQRRAVESLYESQFPQNSLDMVQAGFVRPADPSSPDDRRVLDVTAYVAELRGQLIAAADIPEARLRDLADARAARVVQELSADSRVGPDRLATEPSPARVMTKSGWVSMKLEVSTE